MSTIKPQIGNFVRVWNTSFYYGRIIRLNKKTFTIESPSGYKMRFLYPVKKDFEGRAHSEDGVFYCDILPENLRIHGENYFNA